MAAQDSQTDVTKDDQFQLLDFHYRVDETGERAKTDIWIRHAGVAVIASSLVDFFTDMGGENYVSFTVCHPEKGLFTVTIQPEHGKPPCVIVEELKARIAGLETLPVACPNCGDPAVGIPVEQLETLHSGMSVDCPECGGHITFAVLSPAEWVTLHQAGEKGVSDGR